VDKVQSSQFKNTNQKFEISNLRHHKDRYKKSIIQGVP